MESKLSDRPQLQDGYLGPQRYFTEFGLTTKSHNDPEFETSENEFVIKISVTKHVKMTSKVINDTTGKESLERVFIQTAGSDVSLLVSLDTPGYHRLQIYALPGSEESKHLPGVYNYLIHCKTMARKCRVFPRQFARWRQGCMLLEPFSLVGDHVTGDVMFRVVVPQAHAVAVTIGQDVWCHLEPEHGDTDHVVWSGSVKDIQKHVGSGKVAVLNANLDLRDEAKYFSLLQWTL